MWAAGLVPVLLITVRGDSRYCTRAVVAVARGAGSRFSAAARTDPAVVKAISGIAAADRAGITYP